MQPSVDDRDAIKRWPADKVERRAVNDLLPYARNARTHSDAQVAQIAASIREWGWTMPILVDETGSIIAGHGRVLAARKLKLDDVPVMVAEGWTEAQKRAYVLADNKLTLNAGWDDDLLRSEIAGLADMKFDLPLLGWGQDELAALLSSPTTGFTDPDEVPAEPLHPVTDPGDVWIMGKHRLICGDSTNADDVTKVLAGVTPHLMVTDPPYGVSFDPTWRKGSEKRTYMGGDPDVEHVWKEAWALFPGDVVYIWHAHSKTKDLWIALEELGFQIRQPLIWNKMRFIIGRGDYSFNHEACFYGVKNGGKSYWQGARNQPTVWDIPHRASDTNHGAQKPVECMKRPIENSSSAGQVVYEPFSGSGTTIIAGEETGRAIYAIELNPVYVDVAVIRWQNFTGKDATLEQDGRTFAEIAAERTA